MRPMALRLSSSAVRSCITFCARGASFHRFGSSAWRLSSSRRLRALSKSKMPPQQPDRLLDLVDDHLSFRAHGLSDRCPDANCLGTDCLGTKCPGAYLAIRTAFIK